MSRKKLFLLLTPALILIAGYFALQISLRTRIRNDENADRPAPSKQEEKKADTLGGKKLSVLDLRPLFIERMRQLLKKASNGLYTLSVGDLKIDVLASTLSFQDVTIRPDSKVADALKRSARVPSDVYSIRFKRLLIEGINLNDALNSKKMDYKLVRLVDPVIEIDHRKVSREESEEDFSQRFLKEMEKLSIGNFTVENGQIILHDMRNGTTKKLARVQMAMNDILLDEKTRKDRNRFLFAKSSRFTFHDFKANTKDGLYALQISEVAVNASQKQAVLKNVSFGPPMSKEAFMKRQKLAKEMYGLSFPLVKLSGVDWWPAINGEALKASEIETRGGKFSVYFDRSLPLRNSMGNFPNQLLHKLPVALDVERLQVRDLDISYEEFNPLSQQSGTIYLDKANMDILPLRNEGTAPFLVNGAALLMHKVPISAEFRFDMQQAKTGRFSASVSSNTPFDGNLVNSFAAPLGMMRVEKGRLQKLKATISGDEQGAGGDVLVEYKNLKVSLLEKDKGKTALDKKNVTSLLANLLVLKKNNPKEGKAPRTETSFFKRNPKGGFLMLVWKTILVGVLKTIGAPERIASKKSN